MTRVRTASDERRLASRRYDDLISIVSTTTISVLAISFTVVQWIPLLIAWEVVGVGYLGIVFSRFHHRTVHAGSRRTGPLSVKMTEYLSWALPIAAGVTGVASAVALLTADPTSYAPGTGGWVFGVIGSSAVVVAWLLLQTGFAEVYESVVEEPSQAGAVTLPGEARQEQTLGDLLYLSFIIGTSFSPSGANVSTRKLRWVVLLHSVTSFFYNAFVIAIAYQVLRSVIAGG